MLASRSAVLLTGLGLTAFMTGAALAEEAPLVLPEPPPVEVVVESAAPAAPVAPTAAAVPAAPAQADITLPALPDAPAVFTVADRLASAIGARLADSQFQLSPRLSKKDREAVAAFYALGEYKPLWLDNGAWSAAGRAVIERLRKADEDGLEPADYPVPALSSGADAADLAAADLKLSAAAVLYARDARGARVEPARLSRLITPKLELPSADAVLTRLASAKDAGAALAGFNPPHAGYRALKAKLADIRQGQKGSRIEGDLLANMERWRWLPAEMGKRHIWVNVPEYKLRLVKDGRPIHEARVIVGKPETPTPIFSDEMDHAVVNPSWYVPPSIFKNEFYSDPAYAASRGYEVVYSRGGGVSVRQPPGERNALGFIKFMFPNQHAVYLHDTPNRKLFGAEKRAFSHGCVRLDQPFRFGEFVLGAEWTEARLRSLIGKGERTIRMRETIPVHITYFTVSVDEKGELRQLADLYAVNNKVRVALGLPSDGTKVVAAAPQPQRQASMTPPRRHAPRRQQAVARPAPGWGPDPFSFWWVTR